MGNFYANIVVPGSHAKRAMETLGPKRAAYVAVIEDTTFVYDERCDEQKVEDLRALAEQLSRDCKSPALAALNHDDDILYLGLARDGVYVDVYDSFPGYFDDGSDQPSLQNLDALCEAFDVVDAKPEIEELLLTPHEQLTFEVMRHQQLLELLEIDSSAGAMGYRYVAQGEFEDALPDAELHEVGGDGSDDRDRRATRAPRKAPSQTAGPPVVVGGGGDLLLLALCEIEVPRRFASLLGAGKVQGLVAYRRLHSYIASQGLLAQQSAGLVVRPNAEVAELLGSEASFPLPELAPRLIDRFDVRANFTPEERDAITSNHPSMHERIQEAMMQFAINLRKG